jgi:hypothetical protein
LEWDFPDSSRAISFVRQLLVVIVTTIGLTACGYVRDHHIDGPYRLVAIDSFDETDVCYELPHDACIGRVPATVYAVGFDTKYLVIARHPSGQHSTSQYYYLIRALDGPLIDPSVSVRGPFDAATFKDESQRLGLPGFTYKLSD